MIRRSQKKSAEKAYSPFEEVERSQRHQQKTGETQQIKEVEDTTTANRDSEGTIPNPSSNGISTVQVTKTLLKEMNMLFTYFLRKKGTGRKDSSLRTTKSFQKVGTVIPMAIGNTVLKHTRMDGGSE